MTFLQRLALPLFILACFVLSPPATLAYPVSYSCNYPATVNINQWYEINIGYRNGYYYDWIEVILRRNGSYFKSTLDTPYGNLSATATETTTPGSDYDVEITELSDPSRLHEYDWYYDRFSVRAIIPNTAPSIDWESVPSTVYAGQPITMRARASDTTGNLAAILMDLNGSPHRHDGFSGGLVGNGSGAYLDSYTFTAGLPGSTYLFTAKARDSDGAESGVISHAIVVANRAPTLQMAVNGSAIAGGQSLDLGQSNGGTLAFSFMASDPDGNYQRTRLWVSSDSGANWQEIYNSTAPSGAFNYEISSIGNYIFRANALDASGADSGFATVNYTSQNRAPGPSTLTATKTTMYVGETTMLTATLADADGNLNQHGIWWDRGSPGSNWVHPQVEWGAPPDATGWSNISTQNLVPSNPSYSIITANWTPQSNGTYRFHCAGGDTAGAWGGGSEITIVVSNIPADTEPPSVPAGLAAGDISATSFLLSWNPSTDNVGVTGYEVRQDGVTISDSVIGTQIVASQLRRGTTYSMTVRARDGAGNWSEWSDALAVTTSPDEIVTLPSSWASEHGLNIEDTLGDPDGDGLTNIAEYNLGNNPRSYDAGKSEFNNSVPAIWTLVGDANTNSPPVGLTVGELTIDQNGTATYSVPIAVAQGTAGMEPKLSLNYNSHAGVGIAGFGWSLGGVSAISRGPQTALVDGKNSAISLDREDRFYLDGQRLILINGTYGGDGAEYRTELDSFTRIVSYEATSANKSPIWFRAWTKAGLIIDYGNSLDSSLRPGNQPEPVVWSVNKISDTAGNYMTFHYDQDYSNGQQLLVEIKYTGHQSQNTSVLPYASVVFEYQNRSDVTHRYTGGVKISSLKRLHRVTAQVTFELAPVAVRTYDLQYTERGPTGRSLLTSIKEVGRDGGQLAPLVFEYNDPPNGYTQKSMYPYTACPVALGGQSGNNPLPSQGVMFIDINNDGLVDCIQSRKYKVGNVTYHDRKTFLHTKTGWVLADGSEGHPDLRLPAAIVLADETNPYFKCDAYFVDVNGDGLVDIMTSVGQVYINAKTGWFLYSGYSVPVDYPGTIPEEWLDGQPIQHCSWYLDRTSGIVMDVNGDGRPDFVSFSKFRVDACRGTYTDYDFPDAWINTGGVNGSPVWVYAPEYANYTGDATAIDLNGDGLDDLVYSAYKNNQGRKYTSINTGSGWRLSTEYELPFYLSGNTSSTGSHSYGGCEFVDLNGDGLPDLIAYNINSGAMSQVGVYYNTGKGWTEAPYPSHYPPTYLASANKSRGCAFVDVNNDGLPDFVQAYDNLRKTWLNTGTSWQLVTDHTDFDLPYPLYKTTPDAGTGLVLKDMNGDGAVDVIWNWALNTYLGDYGYRVNRRLNVDRLVKVTNGFGISATFEYGIISAPDATTGDLPFYDSGTGTMRPQQDLMGPYTVVKTVSHDDGAGGTYSLNYRYGGLRAEPLIGSLGYEWQCVSDSRTGLRTITEFSQDYPTIGLPTGVITLWGDGGENDITLYRKVVDYNVKSLHNGKVSFPFAETVIEETYEINGELTSKTSIYSEYDDFGNVKLLEIDTTSSGQAGQYTTKAESTYTNNVGTPSSTSLSGWILGRLTRSKITTTIPGSQGTRTSSFTYDVTTGFLTGETIEPDAGASSPLKLTTAYGYDDFGNKTSATTTGADISSVRTATTIYNDFGRFPVRTINALGHFETYEYDQALGVLLSQTGPNGLTTRWTYDEFGRKTGETRADGTATVNLRQWATGQAPAGSVYIIKTETTGAAPSIAFFDRMGRIISSWGLNPMPDGSGNGRIVAAETLYDNMGRAYATSLPHYLNADPAGWTETLEYDILNRPLRISTPEDSPDATNGHVISTVTYSGLASATKNALGQVEYIEKDTQDRIIIRINNAEAADANERGEINYFYDCFGNLVKTSVLTETGDAIETTFTYDLRGRKLSMTDPDMGTWWYTYNALGELLSQTDAKSQITTMEYDALGRMTLRADHDGTATRWAYDTAALGSGATAGQAKGKLASVQVSKTQPTAEAYTYTESFAYDSFGRLSSQTRVIQYKTYTIGQSYDSAGRPSVTTYPGGFAVKNHYDNLGFLKEVRADGTVIQSNLLNDVRDKHRFWQAESYTVAGAPKNSTLGNGLTYDQIISDVTGRVMAVMSGIGAGTQVQFHEYTYDLLGQVKTRTDHMMGRNESYSYDGLNRLVGYELSAVSPIVPGVPTATPKQLTMQYNAIGNITYKSDIGAYHYASARPHAVASVYNSSTNITRNYAYDANGNQTSGPGRTIEWSSANQVKKITGNGKSTEFLFGASRERIVQKHSDGTTTIYIGSLFEVVTHADGLKEEKYHIFTPLGRTATRTLRSDSLVETRYYHHDALGSTVAVSDEWGRVEKRFAYDPWGNRDIVIDTRARNGGEVTRGFTDHEHLDDFGLIHMNGRVFDPLLARFLSPDPFIDDAGDAQSFNRYSYVNNNPLNATDPSGYFKLKDIIKIVVVVVIVIVVTILTYGAATGALVGMGTITSAAAGGSGIAMAAVAAGGFAGAFVGALMDGASMKQAFRAGLAGAFTSLAGCAVGAMGRTITSKLDMFIFKVGAHGLAGGVAAEIGGGEFRHGFLASAAAAGVDYSGLANSLPGNGSVAGRTIRAGLVGGTVSVIGGGKFANGAYAAAIQHLMNNETERALQWWERMRLPSYSKDLSDNGYQGSEALAKFNNTLKSGGSTLINDMGLTKDALKWQDSLEFKAKEMITWVNNKVLDDLFGLESLWIPTDIDINFVKDTYRNNISSQSTISKLSVKMDYNIKFNNVSIGPAISGRFFGVNFSISYKYTYGYFNNTLKSEGLKISGGCHF